VGRVRTCLTRFVIIPAVVRGFLLLLLVSVLMRGETLEDAARVLAKNVAARLESNETAHVTARNLSSLGRADALRAQSIFEQAIRRRVRNPNTVELTLTISENVKGYLLVADFKRGEERIVEMTPYRPEPAPAQARPALTITKKMLWEQAAPILDIAWVDEQMLVLDPNGVARYERRDGKWTPLETATAAPVSPVVRDPRGRISMENGSVTVDLPGMSCHALLKPALSLNCETGGTISSGRNTFDVPGLNTSDSHGAADGRNTTDAPEPFFSEARIGQLRIVAGIDGRARVYDASGTVSQTIEDWGSDLAAVNTCAGPRVIVSGAGASSGDRESRDSVTLYDFVHAIPIRVSDPIDFPGPVTALWPSNDGALAVSRNVATGKYEAYGLTADCGR
jgi:hypothetical protein